MPELFVQQLGGAVSGAEGLNILRWGKGALFGYGLAAVARMAE